MQASKTFWIVSGVAILIVAAVVASSSSRIGQDSKDQLRFDPTVDESGFTDKPTEDRREFESPRSADNAQSPVNVSAPTDLALPFDIDDFGNVNDFVSPFGLVRFSKDRPELGHGGIDIPLSRGDEIFSPADGVVLSEKAAVDGRGGDDVAILLQKGQRDGEGWVFIFEHITLNPELAPGDELRRGDLIGQSAIVPFSNNHMQLSYAFNNYEFTRDNKCWVEHLERSDRQSLESKFDGYKATLAALWGEVREEGMYVYRGLLDPAVYSGGPQLCYPQGTDVRVSQ